MFDWVMNWCIRKFAALPASYEAKRVVVEGDLFYSPEHKAPYRLLNSATVKLTPGCYALIVTMEDDNAVVDAYVPKHVESDTPSLVLGEYLFAIAADKNAVEAAYDFREWRYSAGSNTVH